MTVWAGGVEVGDGAADGDGLAGADFARDHADRLIGDGPGDAGGGLAAVVVAVQPGGGEVAAERHAGGPEPGDGGVEHECSPLSASSFSSRFGGSSRGPQTRDR